MLTFPAIILPAFIVAAFLLAVLFGYLDPVRRWRYREILTAAGILLALACAGLAVSMAPRRAPHPQPDTTGPPSVEADMLVSRGSLAELWLNDWQHPSEQLPVVVGQRHVYRFTQVPQHITLVRLDPTEATDARMVIYSITVKSGDRIVRQFGPAELKHWTFNDVSGLKEENGGLVMLGLTRDPFLWAPVDVPLPQPPAPPIRPSLPRLYFRSAVLAFAAVLIVALVLVVRGKGRLSPRLDEVYSKPPAMLLSPWFAALIVLLVVAAVHLQRQAEIGLEVDMLVSRGNDVELWCNDWDHSSEILPVVPGQRHVYRFKELPRTIHLLRLDPTDLPGARIVLYSITVKSTSQVFYQFGPADFKNWHRINLSEPQEEDGGLALTDTNNDPNLITPLELVLPGGILARLASLLDMADGPFLLAITAFLLLLLLRMPSRTGRLQALLVAVSSCAMFPAAQLLMKLNLLPPPVAATVGYASYKGYPKAHDFLSAVAALLICIALGCLFAVFAGRGENASYADELEEKVPPSSPRIAWIVHVIVLVLVFLFFLPDLMTWLTSLGGLVYQHTDWDRVNFLLWGDAIHSGLLPYRDFWYPYSGGFMHSLPFPVGALSWTFHATILLGVLYLALFQATGRKLAPALVIFSLLLAPILMDMLPGWARYLLAVDIALFYIAIYDSKRLEWKTHGPFAAFTGYAFFYEPTQVIYAGMGIAVHTLLAALSRPSPASNPEPGPSPISKSAILAHLPPWVRERLVESALVLRQRLVCIGLPMLAGIAAASLFYAANGMLTGLLRFEMSIGDVGDYAAVPSDIPGWVIPLLQPNTVFLLMLLLSGYAVYRWLRLRGREDDRLGAALIVLCGLSFMAMQKQIIRPHIMTQLRLFPYVAVLFFGLIVWRERKPASRIVIAAFVGCILAIAVQRNVPRNIYQEALRTGPQKVSAAIETLLHHRREIAAANRDLFSRSRFVGFDVENAVVDQVQAGLRAGDSAYVLGDSALFYILLNQAPPYSSNSYNDSPIYEQQKVLDWFHRKNPRFVIWVTDDVDYDQVPHTVRLPLIYTYVVEHYEFLRAIGPYHILAERPPDHPPDMEYWRRVLSGQLDLGFIPGRARLAAYAPCGGDVSRCDAVLTVRYRQPKPVPRGKLAVDIQSSAGSFRLQFNLTPGQREYVVNLNRVWFWNPLSKNAAPAITAEDPAAETAVEYRRERGAVLY